jgi:hypothetical protein
LSSQPAVASPPGGLATTALVLRHVDGDQAAWAAAGPLLLGGLGGGMVTSPNVTLTLASVPVRMAGAAGGVLQTAQRIGSAIGTALLASVFYRVGHGSGRAYQVVVSDAPAVRLRADPPRRVAHAHPRTPAPPSSPHLTTGRCWREGLGEHGLYVPIWSVWGMAPVRFHYR